MKAIKNSLFILVLTFGLSACSLDQEHEISGAVADIKQMQILDPMAPENNAGIVNSLEGNVAKQAMNGYQKSTYSPKEGRDIATVDLDVGN
jgi:hypothetical protein